MSAGPAAGPPPGPGLPAFADRRDAGRQLAARLAPLRGVEAVVLGLPRGGVPVALEVAPALAAPLDVIVVRKLGLPAQPEVAMGAIGEGGVWILDDRVVAAAGVAAHEVVAVEARERAVLEQRARRLRAGRAPLWLEGLVAVVVDDGVATGSTARAACQVARMLQATHVVLATPAAPPGWSARLGGAADAYVCVTSPERFVAVGQCYADFSPTTDVEVERCLRLARRSRRRVDDGAGAS